MSPREVSSRGLDAVDDRKLIERWRAGQTECGERLFRRHFDAIYRFFRNKAAADCEELVQRTFRAVLEKSHHLPEIANFRAYLFGVARLELLQHFRRHHRDGRVVDFNEASAIDLDPTPSQYVGGRQELRLLGEALRQIPIDLQIIVELSYWEDLPMADIGELMGIPEGTAKSRLHRARRLLREAIDRLTQDAGLLRSTIDGFDTWIVDVRGLLDRDE